MTINLEKRTIIYVDTNIFLDALQNRINKIGKDIATPAAKLFLDSWSCKYYIAISTWTLKQIYNYIKTDKIYLLFNMIQKKIIPVEYNNLDIKRAKEKSSNNFDDALHIVLAEKIGSDFIVTRNINDFLRIGSNIPIKRPEDL